MKNDYTVNQLVMILEEKARSVKGNTAKIKDELIGFEPIPMQGDISAGPVGHDFTPSIKDILIKTIDHLTHAIVDSEETLKEVHPDNGKKKSRPEFSEAKGDHGDYY
jgi:hypothetical protein